MTVLMRFIRFRWRKEFSRNTRGNEYGNSELISVQFARSMGAQGVSRLEAEPPVVGGLRLEVIAFGGWRLEVKVCMIRNIIEKILFCLKPRT